MPSLLYNNINDLTAYDLAFSLLNSFYSADFRAWAILCQIQRPPSTSMQTPVIMLASSEHK